MTMIIRNTQTREVEYNFDDDTTGEQASKKVYVVVNCSLTSKTIFVGNNFNADNDLIIFDFPDSDNINTGCNLNDSNEIVNSNCSQFSTRTLRPRAFRTTDDRKSTN